MTLRASWLWLVLLLSASTAAYGGRRPFVIGQDSTMVPDGDVEIETWLDYVWNRRIPAGTDWSNSQWIWWLGPRWSPIDGVEVAALTALAQDNVVPQPAPNAVAITAQLWAELVTARWRLLSGERLGSLMVQLDFRLPLAADLQYQLTPSVAWASHVGRFSFTAQVGYAANFRGNTLPNNWIVWNAGASVDAVRGEVWPVLQIGVEAFSQVVIGRADALNGLSNRPASTLNVGPTVSIARGRLWFTLGALRGVNKESPLAFIRGVLGVAL